MTTNGHLNWRLFICSYQKIPNKAVVSSWRHWWSGQRAPNDRRAGECRESCFPCSKRCYCVMRWRGRKKLCASTSVHIPLSLLWGEKKDKQKVQGKQKKEKHFPNVESRFGNRTDVTHTSSALVPCCCVKGLQDEVAHIMHAPRIVLLGYVLLCVPHPDRVCFLTRNTAPSVWLEW